MKSERYIVPLFEELVSKDEALNRYGQGLMWRAHDGD